MKFLIVLALAAIVYSANGASLQKRDLKSDLLARAATLETQTTAEIKKLTDGGRSGEATRLQAEEKRLQTLTTELKDATVEITIRRLETELRAIEMRIAEELRRLERGGERTTAAGATTAASTTAAATTTASLVKRDLRDDLLTRATSLETQATAAVKKLQDGGRAAEATRLEADAKRLQTIATELKDATGDAAIRRLETEIRGIEMRIAEELRRAERGGSTTAPATTAASLVKRSPKFDILNGVASLETRATAVVKKLQVIGRTAEATHLETEAKQLQTLATEWKDATDTITIQRLDMQLRAIKLRIAEELRRAERELETIVVIANIKHLVQTFRAQEKTYVLSFRCIGCTTKDVTKELELIGWNKVAELTSIYLKSIKDESFSNELTELQKKLATFRSNQIGSKIEYTLNVAITFNEIGDAVDGVQYMFRP